MKRRTPGSGSVQWVDGRAYASVYGPKLDGTGGRKRWRIALGKLSEGKGSEKAAWLSEQAEDEKKWAAALERLEHRGLKNARVHVGLTMRELGEQWTSGKLHALHKDHVKAKRSSSKDVCRLKKYVYPRVGSIAVEAFTLDDATRVMQALPAKLSGSSRRHVAQVMHRILKLAVFPLRLIKTNPLPTGFLPSQGKGRVAGQLYPDEDRTLLACPDVPLCYRVLLGFLAREGMRAGEAASLLWSDLDLTRGAVTLDENKTDDPRSWTLTAGVPAALRAWRAWREEQGHDVSTYVFCDEAGYELVRWVHEKDENGVRLKGPGGEPLPPRPEVKLDAPAYRKLLQVAGVRRAELFEDSKIRRPTTIHCLRGTFITVGLANGRTETWISDRTGHKSSQMINTYRQRARKLTELGLGDLTSLDVALPELGRYRNGTIAHLDAANGSEGSSKTPGKTTNRSRSKLSTSNLKSTAREGVRVRPPAGLPGRPPVHRDGRSPVA